MFLFNWLAPAPDSSQVLRPLAALGVPLSALTTLLFFATSRQMSKDGNFKWVLQLAPVALIVCFYGYRYCLLR